MAKYPAMITTNKGRDLVSKSNATGKAINWTRIALGEGQNTGNIYTMIDIVDKKIDIVINKATDLTNGKWKIQGDINNEQLDTGFFCREIGVFAKCEGDENEVLFAYTNGGNYVDYIPDKTTHVDTKKVTCMFAVGDAEHINIINNDEAFLRKEDLNEHNSDPNAHDNRFNAIIQQVNNMITNVDNNDALAKAPTLQLVKNLLSGLNIKNATDVVNALESEKATGLGIRYDFSNENAWYICFGKLFGNLIIQGGINADGKGWTDQNSDSRTGSVKFGIAFNTKPIIVLPTCRIKSSTTEEPIVVNVIHTSLTSTGFNYNADEVGGGYQSRILEYIAIGI